MLTQDAAPLEAPPFGQLYKILAPLTCPNGTTLPIRSIWMKEHLSVLTKFITLMPARKS